MRLRILAIAIAACLFAFHGHHTGSAQERHGHAKLIIVYVIDGLRPDSINATDTPNLDRLRREGVEYINSHAAFPTVTRVNSAVISTGAYPQKNGLVGNAMYVPAVHPSRPFNTQQHELLLKMGEASGGKVLFVPTLSERLAEKGMVVAAAGSGSAGSTFLLNPAAVDGKGALISYAIKPALPARIQAQIQAQFGEPPAEEPAMVEWTERVFRDYVLAEMRPAVAFNWHTATDSAQHRAGVGSPDALKALQAADEYVGRSLAKASEIGLAGRVNVIVVSDHGFALHDREVNVAGALIEAGLKTAPDSDDLMIASQGQSLALHVKGSDPARIRRIVEFLQQQDWADVIFTAATRPGAEAAGRKAGRAGGRPEQGWVPGTFALELVRLANPRRGADIVVTLSWTSRPNAAGVPGTHASTGSANRRLSGTASGHGGISPAVVRNTFLAWGPDFRRGARIAVPAGNADVTPTILELLGLPRDESLDGRALTEAFVGGTDPEKIAVRIRTVETRAGGYRAVVQLSEVGEHWYVDKAWRLR